MKISGADWVEQNQGLPYDDYEVAGMILDHVVNSDVLFKAAQEFIASHDAFNKALYDLNYEKG